jgi:hypothetical protein
MDLFLKTFDLIGSDKKNYSCDAIKLVTSSVTYQSARFLTTGRFYYEITHINGSQVHLAR